MSHVPDGKIKMNMFLTWVGPDGEEIYDNFKLSPNCQYHVDYVLRQIWGVLSATLQFQSSKVEI